MTDLREVLHDAVADVEPADRLAAIRSRTAGSRRTTGRRAAGGALLAVAATVGVVALLARDPAAGPSPVADPTPSATTSSSPSAGDEIGPARPVYYVGDTPRGPRLFREWRPGDVDWSTAIDGLTSTPLDPDYRTYWPSGSIRAVSDPEAGLVHVLLRDDSLAERPAGMDDDEARLALQQLVYTVRAMVREPVDVVVELRNRPVGLFGLPAGEVVAETEVDVRASVNINDPVEGAAVAGSFTARGSANVPEGTVTWQLLDGTAVVRDGFTTATGSIDRHHPWETEIDVSGLEPGSYTLVVSSPDDSGGEGFAPDVDTRTVVVE